MWTEDESGAAEQDRAVEELLGGEFGAEVGGSLAFVVAGGLTIRPSSAAARSDPGFKE
ncbi:hypothetical protein [Actinoplanes sp. NPDC051859]|uniref:hypothetical protein n=1 Tax=Actinoplanes sp. NPDC051859 TaxID=3363909 RepID=UPI00379235CD